MEGGCDDDHHHHQCHDAQNADGTREDKGDSKNDGDDYHCDGHLVDIDELFILLRWLPTQCC